MSALLAGFTLSLSLIAAIGPQNAHVLRMGLTRSYVATTVLACAITDIILIAIGVFSLASLSKLSPAIHIVILIAAFLFLVQYGAKAAKRALRGGNGSLEAAQNDLPKTQYKALLSALAFSWLNPHAWLDTAVLIGSASLSYSQPYNYLFGAGAAFGSVCWFAGLAAIASRLSPYLKSPNVWRGIDAAVAFTMWLTAGWVGHEIWMAYNG